MEFEAAGIFVTESHLKTSVVIGSLASGVLERELDILSPSCASR